MARVRIITDSSACFENPRVIDEHGIRVVPLTIHMGEQAYREGISLGAEEVFQRMRAGSARPRISPPAIEDFERAYSDLSQTTNQIIVLLHSQHLSNTYAHAQAARSHLLGRCEIVVIDSHSTGAGLGYLVEGVARAAASGQPIDPLVHVARGLIPRIYSIYYVDTLDYIQQAGLLGETQALLGAMLDIKALLTIEGGQLITMEKARSHAQAIEKMIEFVAEFTNIEKLAILQSTLHATDQTRMLQDRLALEFGRLQSPVMLYEPLIAARIGPHGMGLAILEGQGRTGSF